MTGQTEKKMAVAMVDGPSSVRRQVYDNLRQAIIELRIKPGQRLVERDLMEMTNASRTSVREALRELIADGLVKTVPYNRHIVSIPTPSEAAELYEVRGTLEALASRRFTKEATDQEVDELRACVEAYATAELVTDRLAAKGKIYGILGTHAPVVYSLLIRLNARVAMLRTMSLTSPGRHEESVSEIRKIIQAIEQRDPDAAERESLAHAERACAVAVNLLEESPWTVALHWE